MNDNSTKIIEIEDGEFISSKSETKESYKSTGSENGDIHGFKYIPTVIKTLEDHFAFTALLISVIGYILISTFGKMDSVNKYFGYIGFLLFSFLFYKLLDSDQKKSNINKFFMIGFFLLLSVLLLKYELVIINWFKDFFLILLKK